MNNVSNCIVCDKPLSGKQRMFCCTACKNQHFLSYKAQKERANARKIALIAKHGGKCGRCGYSYNLSALSFYDGDGESLHVDTNMLANSSYGKLEKELHNAHVLCRNCYEELQSPSEQILKRVQDDVDINDLRQKFTKNLTICGARQGQTIVLGISGGVDSVTMLDLFAQSEMRLHVIVAHMNHGVREEAIQDEQLVRDLAKKYGFKLVAKTIRKPENGNLEEKLRDARREFLLNTAESNNADFVALAHNANDQAETLILNLVRGSGPAGLGAMNMVEGKIIRPLLSLSRTEIEGYARLNELEWHEDKTNRDTNYNRNYIRHRLLPMLERLNPEYLNAIHRTAYLQRKIDERFKEEAYRVIQDAVVIPAQAGIQKDKELDAWLATKNDGGVSYSTEHLRRLDKPLLYEVLGLLYQKAKSNRKNLTLRHLEAIEDLILTDVGSKMLDLPGNIIARRRYDKLDFCSKKEHNTPSAPSTKKLQLGPQKFGDWIITTEKQKTASENLTFSLTIEAETLEKLVIRTRRPGDTILKKGLGNKKKLQDLFVDAKIDRAKRDQYPIFVDKESDSIIWVPGLAKSEYMPKNNIDLYKITLKEVNHETIKK